MAEPLLERASELRSLEAAATAARGGQGGVMLVHGPAGIGKSRLLAAAGERAAAQGMLVLRARGHELERDFAFGVARQLFEPALAAMPTAERAAALEGAAALAVPAIGLDPSPEQLVGGDRLFAAMHGLYWLSGNLATRRPLVIEVDDAHWSDEESLRWLAYLARRVDDLPVLLLAASRVDEGTPASSTLAAIAAEPPARTIEPRPLGPRAAHSLLADVLGVAPDEAVARACHERSAGNPFVLRELAATLAQDGIAADRPEAADHVAGILPDSVARGLVRRLSRLPEPAVELARAVAVLGTDAHLVDAARLADLGERDAADALDGLVDAGFLLAGTALRFAHPLMREAIYGDLPPGRRSYQHRRAADVLAARIAPESIGAHLLQCEPRGDPESVAVLCRCGARALGRGAPQSAARYYTRALEEGPAAEARGAVLRELGSAEARVGRAEAVEHLEEALTLARTPEETAAATRELAIALGALGRMPDAVTALERGVDLLEGRDRELELRLEGELGAMGQLDVAAAPRVAERLHRLGPTLTGATPGERLVLASYAHLRSNELAPPEELADLAERALGDGLLLQEHTADSPVFYLLVYVFFRADRDDLSDRWLAAALDEARTRGSMLGTSVALAVRSQLRWLRGDLIEAEADAQTSVDAQLEAGWASVLPLAASVLAECRLERGDAAGAMAIFEDSGLGGPLPDLHMFRWAQASRGRARLAGGRVEDGLADLRECGDTRMGARQDVALLWRTDVALALASLGNQEEALRLAEEQLARAREAGVGRPLGVALRTLGLLTESRRTLSEAVDVLARSSASLEYARALVELGASVRRAGQRGAAREHLSAGYELARRCGSTALLERAAEELAASGVRMRRRALAGRDALTPSERRVAEMAALGMSNPQIAQSLFVTRKTVEMHLGRVYRKLAVAGREELAGALSTPDADAELVEANAGSA